MITILIAGCAALFLFQPEITGQAIYDGLNICARSILPNLFPFFVLSDIWIRTGAADKVSIRLYPIMDRLFHLPGSAASAFLIGSIGGYPVGARCIVQQVQEGKISKEDGENALSFCNNAGPAFLIGVIGNGLFHSPAKGIVLYIIHILSAMTVGVFFRSEKHHSMNTTVRKSPSLVNALTASITQAGQTVILVCTYVLFFSVIISCISQWLPWFPTGLLELTSGIHGLQTTELPERIVFTLASVLTGFGGICVHLQSLSMLSQAQLSFKKMIVGKTLQAGLSGILSYGAWPLFSEPVPCMAYGNINETHLQWMLIIVFILWLLLIHKITTGKQAKNQI